MKMLSLKRLKILKGYYEDVTNNFMPIPSKTQLPRHIHKEKYILNDPRAIKEIESVV